MIKQAPEYQLLISGYKWLANPYPTFEKFRRCWPVARIDWPQRGAGEWLITKYTDVSSVLRSAEFSINRHFADFGLDQLPGFSPYEASEEPLDGTVLTLDPPKHYEMRRALSAHLSRVSTRLGSKLESKIEVLLKNCVDHQPFDLVTDFAAPLAATMVTKLMDLAPDTLQLLQHWSNIYARRGFLFGPGFVSKEVHRAVGNLKFYLRSAILASARAYRFDNDVSLRRPSLAYERMVNTRLLMLTAGMQTTKHAIANTISVLIDHGNAWGELKSDHKLLPLAINECYRFDGPSQAVGRIAKSDIQLSNVVVPRGAFLRLALASANRDEEVFYVPDTVDILRRVNPHMAFGYGPHSCPGAQAARLTTRLAILGLLRRFEWLSKVPGGQEYDLFSSLRGFSRFRVVGHR